MRMVVRALAPTALLVCCGALPAVAASGWVLPLAGEASVTRPFDPPDTTYGAGHRGVDLAGVPGQQVGSAGAGVVAFAGPLAGRGVISVAHEDGLRTTYEPVTAAVRVGDVVDPGAPLGALEAGHPGCPVDACLHWGLRRGETYLDPMLLLVGPVRLLPITGAVATGATRGAAGSGAVGSGAVGSEAVGSEAVGGGTAGSAVAPPDATPAALPPPVGIGLGLLGAGAVTVRRRRDSAAPPGGRPVRPGGGPVGRPP